MNDNNTANNVFCSSCGALNVKGSKFCSTCGQKLLSAENYKETTPVNPSPVKPKSKRTGLRIFVSLIFAVIGYKLGSSILPMLSYTSWERHVVSYNLSYQSNLINAVSQTALLGGILGAILFFMLGLLFMRLILK